ncbi:MAG: 2-thiouracil desulfurase family protein [Christensenella sp.]|nr:2-thiouracil desulfurase family protein [Christensenella sp.]
MFHDARSRKVVFVSHCFLNQNSISDGTADFPAANLPVVSLLLEYNVGIVQMPCPELLCLGLDRGDVHGGERPVIVENTRIRAALQAQTPAKKLQQLAEQVVYQIEEYRKNGFAIVGVIGINRSPSCGVETTSDHGEEVAGQGLFFAALKQELDARGISLPMIGIKANEPERAVEAVSRLLGE